MLSLLILPFLIIIPTVWEIAFFLKKKSWNIKKKKLVMAGLSTFLLFPILMPAGTIAAIPTPHIVFIGLVTFLDPANLLEMPDWYFTTWKFNLFSIVITFGLFRLISHMIFFKEEYELKKNQQAAQ